jgi:hypothetical protein
VTIAQAEPAQPRVIPANPQQQFLVSLRVSRTHSPDATRDRLTARNPFLRVSRPAACRRVQAIHAIDEAGVSRRIGFDEELPHAIANSIRQRLHGVVLSSAIF